MSSSVTGGPSDESASDGTIRVGTDTLFDVLGNRRRRHVIEVLRQRGERVALDSLAEEVAARENDTDPTRISAVQRKRVYTALQQTHLPKMDQAGVLTFDKENGTVDPSEAIAEFTVYLDVVPPRRLTRGASFAILAVLGSIVSVTTWMGFPVVSSVPALLWAAVLIATFASVAGYYRLRGQPGNRDRE